MNLPICIICLRSGILCKSCQSKLDSGEIEDIDIQISKLFLELENRFPELRNSTFYKAVNADDTIILLVGSGGKIPKTTWNKIALTMKHKLGKNVKIVEKTMSIRQLAEQILFPVKVKSVNTIWLPDGSCENHVKISKTDTSRLKFSKDVAEKILSRFIKENIRIIEE
ncbi:MAG: transcription elongation factor NusA [archaeon YNP-WB-040]|uniref:hypothetical protein n=1 Tax=Candidatus Culexarchaeum yellowstonense TaxID=2928963 RepID=UPI0026F285EA|nr:hypothetical protein [Candidatus Culexarchaeum yellowstonense]MCC6017606.1 transcription elongation factor NusA [Candidatus Verstraetearchaeota archaeon]MCR6669075.1 transcription elongation factor NusA [Candidatus Culexarchaeum yellowstonense]